MADDDALSSEGLRRLLAESALTIERRLGSIEADIREIKAISESQSVGLPQATREIARQIVSEQAQGTRGQADFGMRLVMFGISLGTLIFVLRR